MSSDEGEKGGLYDSDEESDEFFDRTTKQKARVSS